MFISILASAALMVLPACTGPQTTTTEAEENNVTSEELVDETASYVGQTVTVRSEAEAVVDDVSFLMADDEYFEGEAILVINGTSEPFVISDVGDTQVQVTGEVKTFALETVASEYGLTLEPELYAEYETKPVIIAQSIALAPDVGEVAANPEQYYNQRIALQGEVEEVLEAGLFTLDEDQLFGGSDLLVVPSMPTETVEDGEIVAITGVLRPYVKADFERDYDLQWDLSVTESIEAEYTEKPVFVADSVYPSAI
ncbi:MAG: hypothetical protein HC800_25495 [Phormidesmis sp. RL_2_1]|nr:hypothetical protein [Phormidesmis sp. RL_2_1]